MDIASDLVNNSPTYKFQIIFYETQLPLRISIKITSLADMHFETKKIQGKIVHI